MKILSTKYMGLQLKNPIIVGSCGLTSTAEGIKNLADKGAAAVVMKSIFEEEIIREHQMALRDLVLQDEDNMEFLDYLDYQLKNDVLDCTADIISKAKQNTDIPIIASVNCADTGEWISYTSKLEKAGADAIELNIFKLPYDINQKSDSQENLYINILKAVKEKINIPIAIKMSPYSSNLAHTINKVSENGADAITLFNRFYNIDFDIMKDKVKGGVPYSSPYDYSNTLRWVAIMSGKIKTDISASSGIHSAETVIKMLMAGASTVQLVSKLYRDGIDSIPEILTGLKDWMDKRGFVSIDEVRGRVHHEPNENSELFERVQFMKYFSTHNPE